MIDKIEVPDQQYQVVAKATIEVQLVVDLKAGNFESAASRGTDILADKILDEVNFGDVQYLGFSLADTFVEQIIDGEAVDSKWVINT